MRVIDVWPEQKREREGQLEIACTVEGLGSDRTRLWYRFSRREGIFPTERADPFALALLFSAMARHANLKIHGTVCPALLRNLEEYTQIWGRWKPSAYRPVETRADDETPSAPSAADRYLVAFSGGLDGSFTMFRHVSGRCGRQRREVGAALFTHGFDIPLEDADGYRNALEKAKETLGSVDVPVLTVATNWRSLDVDWEDGHAAALVSCLSFYMDHFRGALIGSSNPYEILAKYGSTPLTDPLLSSGSFGILHDGSCASRPEKAELVSEWPEACRNLRVCWEGALRDRNCGKCEKCVRTMLAFKATSGEVPAVFPEDVSKDRIRSLSIKNERIFQEYVAIVSLAESHGRGSEDWVLALKKRLARYGQGRGRLVGRLASLLSGGALRRRFPSACRRVVPKDSARGGDV